MYGKQKENRAPGHKFSDWVQEMFPGLCVKHEVSAALWYAFDFHHSGKKIFPLRCQKHGASVTGSTNRRAPQHFPQTTRDHSTVAPKFASKRDAVVQSLKSCPSITNRHGITRRATRL